MTTDGIPSEISGDVSTENPNANWPRLTWGNNDNNNQKSTFWLRDGRYIRLKNIELRYNVPTTFTRKFFVSNMQIGFIGENLHTWNAHSNCGILRMQLLMKKIVEFEVEMLIL